MRKSFLTPRIFILFLSLFTSSNIFGQMAGTYTIDPSKSASATNYTSITAAVNDLKANFIKADVTFKIADGTYNDSIIIDTFNADTSFGSGGYHPYYGAGLNQFKVTFTSASGDSSKVIIRSKDPDGQALRIGTAHNIIIEKMTLINDSGYSAVVVDGTNVSINKCILTQVLFSGDSVYFTNNKIRGTATAVGSTLPSWGGSYEVFFNGNKFLPDTRNLFNYFDSIGGIRLSWSAVYKGYFLTPVTVNLLEVLDNEFDSGAYLDAGSNLYHSLQLTELKVIGNLFHNTSNGFFVQAGSGEFSYNIVLSNEKCGTFGNGDFYMDVYNNILKGHTSASAGNFMFNTFDGYVSWDNQVGSDYPDLAYVKMQNNIFNSDTLFIDGNTYDPYNGTYFYSYLTLYDWRNNAYNNTVFAFQDSMMHYYTTLKMWKDSSQGDSGSMFADPKFTSATDYTPTNSAIAGKGVKALKEFYLPYLSTNDEVMDDIKHNPRGTHRDIGAIQFNSAVYLAEITGPSQVCAYSPVAYTNEKKATGKLTWYVTNGSILSGQGTDSIMVKWNSVGTGLVKIVEDKSGVLDSDMLATTIDTNCVWPGDANRDKVVDGKDVLNIAIGLNKYGYRRSNTSINWEGFQSHDWNDTFKVNKVNYKNADCDGNGYISYDDTLAVAANFSDVHAKKLLQNQGKPGDAPLQLVINQDSLHEGQIITADVFYGNKTTSAKNVFGLCFGIDFDPSLLDTSYFNIDYTPCWLAKFGKSQFHFNKNLFSRGEADFAITRTDHLDTSGQGKLCTIKLKVAKTLPKGGAKLKLTLINNWQIDATGNYIPTFMTSDSLKLKRVLTGIEEENAIADIKLNVYPNPFSTSTNIEYTLSQNEKVSAEVFDMMGRKISTLANAEQTSGTHSLKFESNGVAGQYILRMQIGEKVFNKVLIGLK